MSRNNKAFGVIEVIVVVVVVALIGLLGWRAWQAYSNDDVAEQAESSAAASQTEPSQAPTITDESGLDESSAALDATNIDASESTKLDSETDF